MEILASSIAAGLLFGMVLALVALGLTIIFGVMDIINFSHGEFLMYGMYTALLTSQALGIDPLLTLPLAALVGFLLGIACYAGFGSVPGAFFAALVVGLITEIPGFWDFLTYTLEAEWMYDVPMTSFKYMWIYVAYFVIMVVRPRGLFGWKH